MLEASGRLGLVSRLSVAALWSMQDVAAHPNPLHGIDRERLQPLVRQVLGRPTAEVESWQGLRPKGWSQGAVTGGLFQVQGHARVDEARLPWSMVLKILHSPGVFLRARGVESVPQSWEKPEESTYWKREFLAYQSGLLETLPGGLRSPRVYAVEVRDEEAWLWLEDVADELPGPWPMERYAQAARELGRFNGAYLDPRRRPSAPWLIRGWLRSWVASRAQHLNLISEPRAWAMPLIKGCFEPSTRNRILGLWQDREAYLTVLEGLPATLCHLDAHPANLLTRTGPRGLRETVAVDWSNMSLAPPGAEAQGLVVGAAVTWRAESSRLEALDAAVSEGYRSGLVEAGADPDPRDLRLAFAATAALRWTFGITGLLLRDAAEAARRSDRGAAPQAGLEAAVADRARLVRYLLDRAEEAGRLLPGLGG